MSTITQFPSGNTQYRIEFDYLARTFVVVTLVNSSNLTLNRVLEVGRDYRFLNPTMIEMLVDQSGFDIVRIHRQTGTDLVVDFRNGSVLTASDLTNSELQAIHIAEEGRDQTVDLAKEYADAAGSSAGNAKDSEDEARRIAESIREAGLIGYITRRSFEKGYNVTTWSEVLLWEEDGDYYRWDGTLPKNVPAGSTPETSGGIGLGAWVSVGDAALRSQISNPEGAILYPELQMARWRDEGDVRGWGAKGDGSADDTEAFKAALATGKNLYIPVGIYIIKETLYFKNQVIKGGGISPSPSLGTILAISHNEAAFKYDVNSGYSMGGYLGGLFIDYGENKPDNYGGRKGIDIGDASQTAWPSQFIIENIIVRGAYFGIHDVTGAFQYTMRNVLAINCWEGFRKHIGTTVLMDTCYALNCYQAFNFANVYNMTMNNCAMDGCNDIQGLQAFDINNCKGMVINGMYSENCEIHHNGHASIYIHGDSTVTLNGYALHSHKVLASSGEAYFLRAHESSRVTVDGIFFGEDLTSTAVFMYPVLSSGDARVKLGTTRLKLWTGATGGASLAALGNSLIEYDNTVFVPTVTVGWCSNNGVVAKGTLAVNTALEPGADLNAGNITLTGDYKPTKGDVLVYGATFDVKSCSIILKPIGENLCNVYIKNLSAGGSVTLLGDLMVQAIRR
ncbi:hypothetical protein [Escherichia phage pO2]|uniref:Probable tail spike protein n=1 Tax=Escherichia phage pO2 TaxID=3062022 RepID=A0AA50A7V1_9CAUD|nr:hypothetical protein [Escherichia phage pO2]